MLKLFFPIPVDDADARYCRSEKERKIFSVGSLDDAWQFHILLEITTLLFTLPSM